MIRELKLENLALKKKMQAEMAANGGTSTQVSAAVNEKALKKIKMLEEQVKANDEEMEDMEKSWEQKLVESKKV